MVLNEMCLITAGASEGFQSSTLTLSLLCNAVPKREHLWFGKTTQKMRALGIVLVAENILGLGGRGNLERKEFWLRA